MERMMRDEMELEDILAKRRLRPAVAEKPVAVDKLYEDLKRSQATINEDDLNEKRSEAKIDGDYAEDKRSEAKDPADDSNNKRGEVKINGDDPDFEKRGRWRAHGALPKRTEGEVPAEVSETIDQKKAINSQIASVRKELDRLIKERDDKEKAKEESKVSEIEIETETESGERRNTLKEILSEEKRRYRYEGQGAMPKRNEERPAEIPSGECFPKKASLPLQ